MKKQLTSRRLNVNAGIMSWYVQELQKLAKQMSKECTTTLAALYQQSYPQISFDESISSQARIALNQLYEKYYAKFSDKSKTLAKSLLNKTNRYANWQFMRALKGMLGDKASGFALSGSAISPEKSEVIKALLFENVSLIKSIPNEYFKQITGAVARSIENGDGVKWLAHELKTYGAKTERRAQLIAQDQTRKAYNTINLRNFQDNNIRKFEWVHSGGSRDPREYHKNVLNGQIFDVDKGALSEDGTRNIYPGQEPYCRCIMRAVLDFDNDKNINAYDAWEESEHPRDKDGKFAKTNSNGGANSNQKPSSTSNQSSQREIAGVKPDKPMSHEQAGGGNVNPKYETYEKPYYENCQSCAVTYELRRRGYNVEAMPHNQEGAVLQLAKKPFSAWLDPETGKPCEGEIITASNPDECYEYLNNKVGKNERYAFVYTTSRDEEYETFGHIVILERDENNNLRWYDPQNDRERIGVEELTGMIDAQVDLSGKYPLKILRTDDKKPNPTLIHEVVQGKT